MSETEDQIIPMTGIKSFTDQIQIVIFLKKLDLDKPSEIFQKLSEKLSTSYDGANYYLPIPNSPSGIPVIKLMSKDNKMSCQISSTKIDFFWNNVNQEENFDISSEEIHEVIKNVALTLTEDVLIKRVGYSRFVILKTKDIVKPLGEKLFQLPALTTLTDYSIQLTYPHNLDVYNNCNKVITVQSAVTKKHPSKKVILAYIDINTNQNDNLKWNLSNLPEFLEEVNLKLTVEEVVNTLI